MFNPPFSALVLDQCDGPEDIPERLLEVRQAFMWLRQDMAELEAEMREADTLGKMRVVVKKQISLSGSIAEKYARKESI